MNISGMNDTAISFSDLRIVRIDSLGGEKNFSWIINGLEYRPDGIRKAAVFHAKLLLIEQCRALCTDSDFRSPHIGEITSYICQSFTKRITITDTARGIGVSVSLLSKEMNRDLGVSFPEYVRRLRVNNVLSLLPGRKMKVTEAAFASGFSSMQGFYRAFHEITGKSPREMLKSGENSSDR